MIDYINEAFKERLDGLTWLDETTKERTKEKVDAILKFVAYPDQLFNDDYVNEIYTDVRINVCACVCVDNCSNVHVLAYQQASLC